MLSAFDSGEAVPTRSSILLAAGLIAFLGLLQGCSGAPPKPTPRYVTPSQVDIADKNECAKRAGEQANRIVGERVSDIKKSQQGASAVATGAVAILTGVLITPEFPDETAIFNEKMKECLKAKGYSP